jgi:hypothetical protein
MTSSDDDNIEPASSAMDSLVGRMEADLARGRPRGPAEPPPSASARTRTPRRSPELDASFVSGLCTGVTGCAILVQIWLAIELRGVRSAFREWTAYFPPTNDVPLSSRIALSPIWEIGAPVAFAAALVALLLFARRRVVPLAVVTVLSVAATTFTYFAATAPLDRIAGQISDGDE